MLSRIDWSVHHPLKALSIVIFSRGSTSDRLDASGTSAQGAAPCSYGEPVRLQGRAIYFTSWKYVRQGASPGAFHRSRLQQRLSVRLGLG